MPQHSTIPCSEASWLISAATRDDLLAKAASVDADIAIFDFEDALAKDQKESGQQAYREHILVHEEGPEVAVRINAISTPQGMRDLLFLLDAGIVPGKIIVPRSGSMREVAIVAELLGPVRPDLRIYPLIESLEGLRALREPCPAMPLLGGLHFGSADMAADIGKRLSRLDLNFYRSEIVFAARLHGVSAIDSPCFRIGDEATLRADCESAARLGFDGKIGIHPSQIPIINEYFRTCDDDIAHARELVSRHREKPVTQVNGDMTGPPFVRYAKKIIRGAEESKKSQEISNE